MAQEVERSDSPNLHKSRRTEGSARAANPSGLGLNRLAARVAGAHPHFGRPILVRPHNSFSTIRWYGTDLADPGQWVTNLGETSISSSGRRPKHCLAAYNFHTAELRGGRLPYIAQWGPAFFRATPELDRQPTSCRFHTHLGNPAKTRPHPLFLYAP